MSTSAGGSLTDVPGIEVGCAADEKARTGVTVILPKRPARAACDVRGGGPGTRETDALGLATLVDRIDALVLAGGSVYGLAAADQVAAELGASGRGFGLTGAEGVPVSPIVPAAILYDLANGGDKSWGAEPPYRRLAGEALGLMGSLVPEGQAGAGFGALAGTHPGGQGTASARSRDGFVLGAIAAVNSFGSPYLPGTNAFWAAPYEVGGEFGGRSWPSLPIKGGLPPDTKLAAVRQATTLVALATDAPLSAPDLKRLAIMAQDGLARALRPAHGPTDGDVVFALSTAADAAAAGSLALVTELGSLAGDVTARAIARGVYHAEGGAGAAR
jgi:L-aminopeptidase/D-esterase-like protein